MTLIAMKLLTDLSKYKFTFENEAKMQEQVEAVLRAELYSFKREFKLTRNDRLDFWLPQIGAVIECKMGGSLDTHARQLKRYADCISVQEIILIGTRQYHLPDTISGKPVACLSIGNNRL